MISIPSWLLLVAILSFPFYAIFDLVWRTFDNYLRFKCENSVPPQTKSRAIGFEIPQDSDGYDEENLTRTNTRRRHNIRRDASNGNRILHTTTARLWEYCRCLLLERPRRG